VAVLNLVSGFPSILRDEDLIFHDEDAWQTGGWRNAGGAVALFRARVRFPRVLRQIQCDIVGLQHKAVVTFHRRSRNVPLVHAAPN
jgi:hypothetical protein